LLGNFNRFVDDSHNHIIVVAIRTVFKHDSKGVKEVIGEEVQMVGLLNFFLKSFIHVIRLRQRILLLKVLKDFVSNVLIEVLDFFVCEFVLLSKFKQILEDVFRAKHFRLLKSHLLCEIIMKGSRKCTSAYFGHPFLGLFQSDGVLVW
jgi:hypothetical protein